MFLWALKLIKGQTWSTGGQDLAQGVHLRTSDLVTCFLTSSFSIILFRCRCPFAGFCCLVGSNSSNSRNFCNVIRIQINYNQGWKCWTTQAYLSVNSPAPHLQCWSTLYYWHGLVHSFILYFHTSIHQKATKILWRCMLEGQ